jgi:hypothetical protein
MGTSFFFETRIGYRVEKQVEQKVLCKVILNQFFVPISANMKQNYKFRSTFSKDTDLRGTAVRAVCHH